MCAQHNFQYDQIVHRNFATFSNTVESRKQLERCINFSIKIFQTISVVFKILLNSIVCFLHISSSYFRVRGIIKVVVFSRFYGSTIVSTLDSYYFREQDFVYLKKMQQTIFKPSKYVIKRYQKEISFIFAASYIQVHYSF